MRKVLSFVLVLTLVLSSFSMAFAADTKTAAGLSDVAGNANEDAIQVAYDLEIVTGNPDGTFAPAKAVNRAEFAAMLTRALDIPASALAGYTNTSFKDTAGYAWAVPYLAFCQSKGILIGDGAGNVMPGKTISVNEAMTMALRAIGYTANSSLLVGVWPSNYVSIAQNNDLYDDVAKTTTVDKANAAQIIYNLLTVQKVAVNSDGTTDYLWKDKKAEKEANLLNTNLGAKASEDVVLGTSGLSYGDALVNVSKSLGAHGDAYLNSDNEVIAFTKDSTALTGSLNKAKDKFEVGDVDYDLGKNTVTQCALFLNGDLDSTTTKIVTGTAIAAFAANSDDGETVTLNVDLSGKTIKDIYSVVAWKADKKELASTDVQEDIADKELGSIDFDTDDDNNINMKSFELVGVASLDKIAKDNVLYVYESADDKVIRKVTVGTEKVEGTIDEVDMNDADTEATTITVGGKDYDVAANATQAVKDLTVDDEGKFYLDAAGEVYDFDGTSTIGTYGIIKASDSATVRNIELKLYTSEDSTKTFTLSDEIGDMDWTSKGAAVTKGALHAYNLIGYSLDSNGNIDEIDNTAVTYPGGVTISSTKVLNIAGKSYTIKSNAVILTYKDATGVSDPNGVAAPGDLKTGKAAKATIVIFNKDKDVIAMYISDAYADASSDTVYGVINTRTTAKNTDGDKVYRYKGFIDGTAFSYLSDDDTVKQDGPYFGVYGFDLDSSNNITKITDLSTIPFVTDKDSGWIAKSKVLDDVNDDRTILTVGTTKYTVDDKAKVYKYDTEDKEFTVEKLSALRAKYTVSLFDTEGNDADGEADVVVYIED